MAEPTYIDKLFASAQLTDTERRVLLHVLKRIKADDQLTIRSVAQSCYTSMTTVTRTARKLGYDGFREMLYGLKRDTHVSQEELISSEDMRASFTYRPQDLERFFEILDRMEPVGIYGEGYSHLISEYIERKMLGNGHLIFEQSYLESSQFVHRLGDRLSLMILVSRSGATDEVVATARECRDHGVPTAVFVGSRRGELAGLADILFVVDDDQPLDTTNSEPSNFTGCCILAFERVYSQYVHHVGESTSA